MGTFMNDVTHLKVSEGGRGLADLWQCDQRGKGKGLFLNDAVGAEVKEFPNLRGIIYECSVSNEQNSS